MSKWQSERSIHEMLKDTPPIRECSDSITTGTEPKITTSQSLTFPPTYTTTGETTCSTTLSPRASKLDAIRTWSLATYKCTRQLLYEKLGKTSRTVDTELEASIECVRETQRKYQSVLRLSLSLSSQLRAAACTQRALADAFADLAHRDPHTRPQFLHNADSQRTITRNSDALLAALCFFNNALNTLANKTMEDTLITIRQYEAARVEYDAYRSEAECAGAASPALQAAVAARRDLYRRLRGDAAAKLRLLDDNRIKVMNKQLVLFHNATAAFFSGNQAALDATLRQFAIKPANHVNSNSVPTNNIPTNSVPTNNIPTNSVPTNNIPTNNIPTNSVPANSAPTVPTAPSSPPAHRA